MESIRPTNRGLAVSSQQGGQLPEIANLQDLARERCSLGGGHGRVWEGKTARWAQEPVGA